MINALNRCIQPQRATTAPPTPPVLWTDLMALTKTQMSLVFSLVTDGAQGQPGVRPARC